MRYCSLEDLQPGMVIAKNIYFESNSGAKIVGVRQNAVLSETLISGLQKRGIRGVYIEDELSRGVIIDDYFSDETKSLVIQALKSKKIENIYEISKKIVKENYGSRKVDFDFYNMINTKTEEEHALSICELSLFLANQFGFNNEELSNMANTALLHNIAKIIPVPILASALKNQSVAFDPGKLDYLYPFYGYHYLKSYPYLTASTKQAILFGSVNENGTGFPFKLEDQDKHLLKKYSKILLICDYFETYLKRFGNPIDARAQLQKDVNKGVVDKKYADIFLERVPVYPVSSMVELSNGDIAIVVRNNAYSPDRPVVRTDYGLDVDLSNTKGIGIVKSFMKESQMDIQTNNIALK